MRVGKQNSIETVIIYRENVTAPGYGIVFLGTPGTTFAIISTRAHQRKTRCRDCQRRCSSILCRLSQRTQVQLKYSGCCWKMRQHIILEVKLLQRVGITPGVKHMFCFKTILKLMPLSPRGCLRTGPFSSSSITAVVHTVPSMFDTTLTAFAVLCTAMLTSAHPGSMICNDPRLTEGGNMMHAFVTINNHQTDLLLEANATQYKVIIYIYNRNKRR